MYEGFNEIPDMYVYVGVFWWIINYYAMCYCNFFIVEYYMSC